MKRSAPPAGASIGARGCSRVIYFLEKGSYSLPSPMCCYVCQVQWSASEVVSICAVCCVVSSSRRSTIWGLHTPQGSPFTLFIGYEQYCLANKLQLKLFQTVPLKNKNFPSVLLFVIFFLLPSVPTTLNILYLFL